MTWVKLDDHFDENPKIASVGPLGLALWVTGLAYCNRNLTDGFIPTAIALRMLSLVYEDSDNEGTCTILIGGPLSDDDQIGFVPDGFTIPNLLLRAGLWDSAPGGFVIHDYDQFQPLKAQIEAERAEKQAAGRAGGIAAARARATASAHTGAVAKSKPVPVPVPVPVSLTDPTDLPESAPQSKPLPLPKKTTPTEEWAAEMREKYRLRDFDETLRFHMNGSYYRTCADKCTFLEKKLEAAAEREATMRGGPSGRTPTRRGNDAEHADQLAHFYAIANQ